MVRDKRSGKAADHDTPKGGDREPPKGPNRQGRLKKAFYEAELVKLQTELVKLQEWIKYKKLKIVVIFEGRDAAGKGGAITRITQQLNPRICRDGQRTTTST